MTLEGWNGVQGSVPTVVSSPSYSGEPALRSSSVKGSQIDFANKGFVTGLTSVSFQVALHTSTTGDGYFGLGSSDNSFVAVVGVSAGEVVAGPDLSKLKTVEPVPTGTAFPLGWVYIIGNVYKSSGSWVMQVFVDQTDVVAKQVSVPNAGAYSGALIETTMGTADYSNVIVSSYQLATLIPGYNNMEGYGQGSALLVKLLPAYYNLTARMTLNSWSTPQRNILSFQINAMNETGTKKSTCDGFFQLGLDLNPGGAIAPWYVPGINCEAHYFAGPGGISSPAGTQLVLSIIFEQTSHEILFKIVDSTTSQTFMKSIPYNGGAFFASYTQMEFQPCCNTSPIGDYKLQGVLYDMQTTTLGGQTQKLPASYMLPFNLDAPPTWDLTYYQNSVSGYAESSI
jgi:hypothetical protein